MYQLIKKHVVDFEDAKNFYTKTIMKSALPLEPLAISAKRGAILLNYFEVSSVEGAVRNP